MDTVLQKMKWALFSIVMFSCFVSCEKDPYEGDSGRFVDNRDNREYKWVRIGKQVWMTENFAYSPEIYPDTAKGGVWMARFQWIIPPEEMTLQKKEEIRNARGCLYNWEKAIAFCPNGWHLPTDEEWMELEQFLGMKKEELNLEGERGVNERIGGKLKEKGTLYWDPPNMGATNSSGFSARPCGHHNFFARYPDATFKFYDDYFTEVALYWTATADGENAIIRYLDDSRYGVFRRKFSMNFGYSVRYVRND